MSENINELANFFKALSDPTRIKLLRIMLSYNNLCVGMIAKKLDITQPAVSQHLKILKNAGIVKSNRMGFHIHYSVNNDIFKEFGLKTDKIKAQNIQNCESEKKCKSSPEIE